MRAFSRRHFLIATALSAVLSSLRSGAAAAALTEDGARRLIDKVVADINAIINSGEDREAMFRDFEKLFKRYADLNVIARKVMGPAWRRATPAQRQAFKEAFARYMARKYGKRFREFIGAEIKVTGVRRIKSFYEVRSVAKLRGQAPFEVRWLVSDKSGKTKFFNMFVEGVNMLTAEAQEVQAMLRKRKGNIDRLIRDLPKAA